MLPLADESLADESLAVPFDAFASPVDPLPVLPLALPPLVLPDDDPESLPASPFEPLPVFVPAASLPVSLPSVLPVSFLLSVLLPLAPSPPLPSVLSPALALPFPVSLPDAVCSGPTATTVSSAIFVVVSEIRFSDSAAPST